MPTLSRQPAFSGLCAHYSIYHACALAGAPQTHDDIFDGHGRRYYATFSGINEQKVMYAFKYLRFKTIEKSVTHLRTAIILLDKFLKKGYPVLTTVDDGNHWVVIAGKINNAYIVVDSNESPIVQTVTPANFEDWVGDDDFYFIAVKASPEQTCVPLRTTDHRAINGLIRQR